MSNGERTTRTMRLSVSDGFFDKKYLDFRFDVLVKGNVDSCLSICRNALRCKRFLSKIAISKATLDVPGLVIFITLRAGGRRLREAIEVADQLIEFYPEESRSVVLDHARCVLAFTECEEYSHMYSESDREWVAARNLLEVRT